MSMQNTTVQTQQAGEVLYFAYGSNMSSRRLQARVPSARVIMRARLIGHQLRFHKHSRVDNSAKCDAFYTGNSSDEVWGVLFRFNAEERPQLDEAEGEGYQLDKVCLAAEEGEVEAVTYLATLMKAELKPYDWYLRHVLEGAREHALPSDYIAVIESVSTIADADQRRCQKELAIYR